MACVTKILYITFHVVPGGHAFDVDQGASDTGVGFEHGMGSQHDIVAEITVLLVGGIIIIFGGRVSPGRRLICFFLTSGRRIVSIGTKNFE